MKCTIIVQHGFIGMYCLQINKLKTDSLGIKHIVVHQRNPHVGNKRLWQKLVLIYLFNRSSRSIMITQTTQHSTLKVKLSV